MVWMVMAISRPKGRLVGATVKACPVTGQVDSGPSPAWCGDKERLGVRVDRVGSAVGQRVPASLGAPRVLGCPRPLTDSPHGSWIPLLPGQPTRCSTLAICDLYPGRPA